MFSKFKRLVGQDQDQTFFHTEEFLIGIFEVELIQVTGI